MKHIFDFFSRWAEKSERRERERQEAYLAQATDIADLEARMRELDWTHMRKPNWLQQQPL